MSKSERRDSRQFMNEYASSAFKDMISPGHSKQKHRERLFHPFDSPSAFAARPYAKDEWRGKPDAMKAYWKEWAKLQQRKVWGWGSLCEWDEVSKTARNKEKEAHLGFLFGIMVEKGAEYGEDDPRRYFK